MSRYNYSQLPDRTISVLFSKPVLYPKGIIATVGEQRCPAFGEKESCKPILERFTGCPRAAAKIDPLVDRFLCVKTSEPHWLTVSSDILAGEIPWPTMQSSPIRKASSQ
jgi:hypothetical protein